MRGCERKIILLKGTESQMFDEAYFLVRKEFEKRGHDEIVREAQRIIDRNTTRLCDRRAVRNAIYFALGLFSGAVLALFFFTIAL